MDGPFQLMFPPDTTPLEFWAVTGKDFCQEKLAQYTDLARDVGPEREKCLSTEREATNNLTILTRTVGDLTAARETADAELRKEQASAWDEVIQNPACNAGDLAVHLRPMEDKRTILTDAKDLLVFKRIPAARLQRMEATLALRKFEA